MASGEENCSELSLVAALSDILVAGGDGVKRRVRLGRWCWWRRRKELCRAAASVAEQRDVCDGGVGAGSVGAKRFLWWW